MSTKAKAAKTVRQEASLAWQRDQLDPDNWLQIPEFGVEPAAVQFEGFSFAIVEPLTYGDSLHEAMRELVRTVRQLARVEFQTLSDLNATGRSAFDAFAAVYVMPGDATGLLNLTVKQKTALRYMNTMLGFREADRHWFAARRSRSIASARLSTEYFATSASMVVNWLTGRPFERDLGAVLRLRQSASKGGRSSGNIRRGNTGLPEPEALRAEEARMIADGIERRDVAGILAGRYKHPWDENSSKAGENYSVSHIRKILRSKD